jgi:hypothetical protein
MRVENIKAGGDTVLKVNRLLRRYLTLFFCYFFVTLQAVACAGHAELRETVCCCIVFSLALRLGEG